jgi:predicted GIY-YIG superfamily endonuclease
LEKTLAKGVQYTTLALQRESSGERKGQMKKEKLIAEIERLFIHRRDDYAQQVRVRDKEKGRWIWVFKRKSEPITNEILLDHLVYRMIAPVT